MDMIVCTPNAEVLSLFIDMYESSYAVVGFSSLLCLLVYVECKVSWE